MSVLAPSPKGPAPVVEPTVVNTRVTSSTGAIRARARSAAASVSCSVLPGGSSILTAVWPRSAAGTKPLGSSGTSASDSPKNSSAALTVVRRCVRHQSTTRR